MKHSKSQSVNQCIREAACQAAATDGLSIDVIEQFLRTGEEAWQMPAPGRYTPTQMHQDRLYSRAAKDALRILLSLLGSILPPEVRQTPAMTVETIRHRVEGMVTGLVQLDWQEIALRELTARTYVLNFLGARAAMDAELVLLGHKRTF
jgi:hypothetical protein